MPADRLQRDAAGVEGDALADQAQGRAGAAARVAQDDQPRLLGAALADRDQAAHLLGGDLLAAEHLDADRVVGGGDLFGAGRPGRTGWRRWTGRLCRSRARFWASAQTRAASAAAATRVGRQQRQRLEPRRRRVVGVGAAEAVEAVGAEDRAGDEALGRRGVVLGVRAAPRRARSPRACRPPWPPAPRRPAARSASSSSRLPRPTTRTRPAARGSSIESFLKPPLASAAPARRPARTGSSSPS